MVVEEEEEDEGEKEEKAAPTRNDCGGCTLTKADRSTIQII